MVQIIKASILVFIALFVPLLLLYLFSWEKNSPAPIQNLSPVTNSIINLKPIILLAGGDIACSPQNPTTPTSCQQFATSKLIATQNPDILLALGDLQYQNGSLENFRASFDKSWGKFNSILYPSPGNHEYETASASGYFTYFSGQSHLSSQAKDPKKGYYSFDRGSWHFVGINANCWAVGGCTKDSPELKWLEADLAENKNSCVLAFWHQPLFSSGHHGSNLYMKPFWDILHKYHSDVILNGHDHLYERFAPQDSSGKTDITGPRQFTVGTGGYTLYEFKQKLSTSEVQDNTSFGLLKLTLSQNSYTWKFLSVDTNFTDSGEKNCYAKN